MRSSQRARNYVGIGLMSRGRNGWLRVCIAPILLGLAGAEVIEVPQVLDLRSRFSGKLLEIFRAGSPPPMVIGRSLYLGPNSRKAPFWVDGKNTGSWELKGSSAYLTWTYEDSISDLELNFTMAEGLKVYRSGDGATIQVTAESTFGEFARQPDGWIMRLWNIEDTRYGDILGTRVALPDRKAISEMKVREIARDPEEGRLEVIIQVTDREGESCGRYVLTHGAKRTVLLSEDYIGHQVDESRLRFRNTVQRIYWADGPGYRQMTRTFKGAGGQLVMQEDIDEYYRVDDQGVRSLDKRDNRLNGR